MKGAKPGSPRSSGPACRSAHALATGIAAKAPLAGIVGAASMPARDIDGQGAGFAAQVVTAILGIPAARR